MVKDKRTNRLEENIMDIYRSRWRDRDMRDLAGSNKLYEVVKYYGGYLYYCKTPKAEERTYDEFYNKRNNAMEKIFINLANADAKKHLDEPGVSGTRMRRMLITGEGKIVRAYEWISEYVEYILDKCIGNDVLKDGTLYILHSGCDYCEEYEESNDWRTLCTKRLLGFQYTLLREVGRRNSRVSESAAANIHVLENSDLINGIIGSCPVIIDKRE